uniref:Uncharacterized protein n=1 Tax=Arundo donax TaxID=35708 RepID=A0A0A8YS01_ARUDO
MKQALYQCGGHKPIYFLTDGNIIPIVVPFVTIDPICCHCPANA